MKIELAGCVITDDYNRILLLHRNNGTDSQWELPGGKVEDEEAPEHTATREIYEELGVEVKLTKSLGKGEFETNTKEYEYNWFLAVIEQGQPTIMETETFDELDYFDVEDIMSLSLSANMVVLLDRILQGLVVLDT